MTETIFISEQEIHRILDVRDWNVILHGRDSGSPKYEFRILSDALQFAKMFKPKSYRIFTNLNTKTITVI